MVRVPELAPGDPLERGLVDDFDLAHASSYDSIALEATQYADRGLDGRTRRLREIAARHARVTAMARAQQRLSEPRRRRVVGEGAHALVGVVEAAGDDVEQFARERRVVVEQALEVDEAL